MLRASLILILLISPVLGQTRIIEIEEDTQDYSIEANVARFRAFVKRVRENPRAALIWSFAQEAKPKVTRRVLYVRELRSEPLVIESRREAQRPQPPLDNRPVRLWEEQSSPSLWEKK